MERYVRSSSLTLTVVVPSEHRQTRPSEVFHFHEFFVSVVPQAVEMGAKTNV
jgi:hypothetical protein